MLLFVCPEIWDALKVAAESDLALAQTIVDSAGIIVSNPDMTLCYDERGAKYELPKYVLSEPTNLIRDGWILIDDLEDKTEGHVNYVKMSIWSLTLVATFGVNDLILATV